MDKIIPVVVIKELEQTIPTLKALQNGGINIAEITFRTACAEEAIKLAVKHFPDMLIGAGTVINIEQCKKAINAGAKFIVSPGYNIEVGKICKEKNLPYYPGCVTPTEIMSAIEAGFTILKFFPANIYGGLKALKALSAPFPQIKFIPTGGVDENNLAEFLAFDKIFAVGGSFMMKGSYEEITEKSRLAVKIAEESK
jgi:2-dehydro-3-deoxyphosphogluconate aldolase/(4S)-4-hydroxy-2-oxoglutarate aldolase